MIKVHSPHLIRTPPTMLKTDVERTFWRNMDDFLFRLWRRSGGGDDLISNTDDLLIDNANASSRNKSAISELSNRDKVVIATSNITAKPFETIICTNTTSINVTLETNPIQNDIINVKRTDGEVIVIGTIDGVVNKVINVQYWSMKLIYTGTEWVAI